MKFIKKINDYVIPFSSSQYIDSSEAIWAEGAGRQALDGTYTGTKIGNFPKLSVEIPSMPNSVQARFKRECKKSIVKLEWYSTTEEKHIISEFYPGPVNSQVMAVIGDTIIMQPFVMEFTTIGKE